MKKIILITTIAAAILFSGCSNQELVMAQSAASAASLTQGTASTFNASLNQVGVVQGQAVGYSMLANPMTIGMYGVAGVLGAKAVESNKKGYANMNKMMVNQNISEDMVKAYNKKYGTRYTSMAELQNSQKI